MESTCFIDTLCRKPGGDFTQYSKSLKEAERERSHLCCIPQMPTTAPDPGKRPGARAQSRSPQGGQAPKSLSRHCCLPESASAGSGNQERAPSVKPDALMWGVGINHSAKCLPRAELLVHLRFDREPSREGRCAVFHSWHQALLSKSCRLGMLSL